MKENQYFYRFFEPISKELALLLRELESSIFTSPRTMIANARPLVEGIVNLVLIAEKKRPASLRTLVDRIRYLEQEGILSEDAEQVRRAMHHIRKLGNEASHQTRQFYYYESLLTWRRVYEIVRWFVQVYGPLRISVPAFQEPSPQAKQPYSVEELDVRFKKLESLLDRLPLQQEVQEIKEEPLILEDETMIRTISYRGENLDIPSYLRDSFLLPQRFPQAEKFLIALGGVQQARLMSELPANLEGISKLVKRYKDVNEQYLFEDLKVFVEEERKRKKVTEERPGELLIFFRAEYLVMTASLAKQPIDNDSFKGMPNVIRQLNEAGISRVGQLPKELLVLGKFDRVGPVIVEKFFRQLEQHAAERAKAY
ncbi:DUF4145 domain-containing protein [Paenalkalicoccus suaedae]|uniref:DUF4145 domain-containing protein n=1 Tax=Paenalkalicoccus suaedae TaxID=2592382 RepID=A0A859FAI6_9BACI|nr:DUF4145 domain-containing protein [Paenalkalicoccus suaedae]QKS69782.1 DUF4145 domain-containing protein [Paenalkalicoccus suaedae]